MIFEKNIYVLETCLKRNIVFCLILTELFLLKYTHKHIINLLFSLVCFYLFNHFLPTAQRYTSKLN